MRQPLYLAFIWHMHQPYYRDTVSGRYTLPWVRLHATKDYLHLARIAADFPTVRQTFNFVPCLVEQILDYGSGTAVDRALELSRATTLTDDDKRDVLRLFFAANENRFIHPTPRYDTLFRLREAIKAGGDADTAFDLSDVSLFSDAYWIDLLCWFNLAWIDPAQRDADPALRALVRTGERFSRDDLALILERQHDYCAAVLPAYRALAERGQIELTTSPYYHPILPLLVDSASARQSSPTLPLPRYPIAVPEDADEQLTRAVALHERVFGRTPVGLWPSEEAISADALALVDRLGTFRWAVSDEHVLERALGKPIEHGEHGELRDAATLGRPYLPPRGNVTLVFRDQILSDRIGFVYQNFETGQAVDDLIGRIHGVADLPVVQQRPTLLTIALDGENCWESYPDNGDPFLRGLFAKLADDPVVQTITPGDFISRFPATERLSKVVAGSWISSNLETWIGEPAQNRAWDALALARAAFVRRAARPDGLAAEAVERARTELLVSEGSDWYWWYCSRNRFGGEWAFDADFRLHLGNVYRWLDVPVPEDLATPFLDRPEEARRAAVGYVHPTAAVAPAGQADTHGWLGAAYLDAAVSTGSMQRGQPLLRRLYVGHNPAELCLRIEGLADLADVTVTLYLSEPGAAGGAPIPRLDERVTEPGPSYNRDITIQPGGPTAEIRSAIAAPDAVHAAIPVRRAERAIEVVAPLGHLGLAPGARIALVAAAWRGQALVDLLPIDGTMEYTLADLGQPG